MNLGTLWFDTQVKDTAVNDVDRIRTKLLEKLGEIPVTVKIEHSNIDGIRQRIADALSRNDFKIKVNIDPLSLQKFQRLGGLTEAQARAAKAAAEAALAEAKLNTERQRGIAATANAERAELQLQRAREQAARSAAMEGDSMLQLKASMNGGIQVASRFRDAMIALFSVHVGRQFLDNVIEIGGQLEKQRISIGAILGDIEKANHLFGQIKELALKSPFGVVELDQYTKQLSAYGFKYNELFDMTKRLADISAGAGQDIGRLTLALGHVRSATYLTGITLRQFSMNNIPMLKMLADYYSEVEKKAVSTAEVQKRISKRQVSYEDVIEQIRRLTDEGGMFYNMQEKISESLSAKYKNLKDAMDIMYGEMAEGKLGDFLKGVAANLLKATRHWKEIAVVMGVAGAAFVANRIKVAANTAAMQGNTGVTLRKIMADKQVIANNAKAAMSYRALTIEEERALATANKLTATDIRQAMAKGELAKSDVLNAIALRRLSAAEAQALVTTNHLTQAEVDAALAADRWRASLAGLQARLKNTFMGIGAGTWATLGILVGTELYMAFDQWVKRIDEKSQEMKDLIKSRIIDLNKMQKTIDKEGMPKDQTALKGRVDEMRQVLADSEAYTKTLDEQFTKAGNLNKQYDILKKAIKDAADENKRILDYQDSIAAMIKSSKSDYSNLNYWQRLMVSFNPAQNGAGLFDQFFNDDVKKNMEQVLASYKDLRKTIETLWEYKDALHDVIEEMSNSGEMSEDIKKMIDNAPFEEQLRILAQSPYWQTIVDRVTATNPEFDQFANRLVQSSNKVTSRWNEIADDDLPKMLKKFADERGMDEKQLKEWAYGNIDDFKLMLEGILDQLEVKEPAIRRYMKRIALDYVTVGKMSEALAKGLEIGASPFGGGGIIDKLLNEKELADIKDSSPGADTGSKSGNKKDEALERAKTKLAEYKAFLSEYKKYREHYSKEKAINILEKLFPNLKGSGENLVDNYARMLEDLAGSLDATTEARKKFINEVNKTKADTLFDREKETMKENVEEMKEYTKKLEDHWKLYRSLLKKSGGNKEFAQLAFTDGALWDETAKQMLDTFNKKAQELGVLHIGFNWDMSEKELKESLVDANGVIQEQLVDLALEIQKIVRENRKQFLEDTAEAYSKSLTAEEKLYALQEKRAELVEKLLTDNDSSGEQRNNWGIQVKALDKEIASQEWEAFKETEQWGRIFANLEDIGTETLTRLLGRLRELAPQLSKDVEATKALYDAMDKMETIINKRNPIQAITGSISVMSAIRELTKNGLYGDAFRNGNGTYTMGSAQAKALGLSVNKSGEYTQAELDDAARKAMNDLTGGLSGLGEKFKAMEDVLKPVIDLFDYLGHEELGDMFSMGNNAFGAAVGTAQGLSSLGLGNLGPYGAAAAAALSVATSIAQLHDKALQKEIEASEQRQKEMENISKNLEKILERTLGGVYNTSATGDMMSKLRAEILNPYKAVKDNIAKIMNIDNKSEFKDYIGDATLKAVRNAEKTKSYYDAAYASLLAQYDEVQHQMQMEEDKKKSDSDKIADYKQQLTEMDDEIKHFAEDMAKSLYDIDVKSWASELGDALFEAWQKGESGAEAFKKKATELIADVAKNIVVTKFIETAMSDVLKTVVSEMERTKGMLDEMSIERLAGQMEALASTLPDSFDSLMDGLNEGIKRAGLIDLKELGNESGSSSLSSGIKGITEQTADLLASYVNAIRADVSVIRANYEVDLPSISSAVHRTSVLAEAQVALQTQIADNTYRSAELVASIERILVMAGKDKSFGFFMR